MIRMRSTDVDIRRIYPLMHVDDEGVALNRRGQFTVGYELEFPVAYSADEADYDEMLLSFGSACRVLPTYTVIHRQDTYLYEDYRADGGRSSLLARSYEAHFDGRRRLVHRAFLFLTTSTKNLVSSNGRRSALRMGYPDGLEVPDPEKAREWLARCGEFISALCNCGTISARRLTRGDWAGEGDDPGIVQRYLQLGDSSPVMSHLGMAPDRIERNGQVLQCYEICESEQLPGEIDSTSRVETLSSSSSEVRLSFASRLGMLLPCEHVLNHYIIIPSQQDVTAELDRKRRRMVSGITSTDNRINSEEISAYLDEAYRKGLVTVLSCANVLAWGPTEDAAKIRGELSSAFTALGVTALADTLDTPVVFYAGCPGAEQELGSEHLMTQSLRSVLALSPYETFEKGVERGTLHMCDRNTHTPITIDTLSRAYELGLIQNMNAFTLGGSGSGKSFFTNHYAQNCYEAGHHVFIIDVGDSYEGLTHIISEESGGRDGQYLSWSIDHPFSFNPFAGMGQGEEPVRDEDDDDDIVTAEQSGMNFIMSFLKTAYEPEGGWTTTRATILSTLVEGFFAWYASKGTGEPPIFDDFYRYVDEEAGPRITFTSLYAEGPSEETIEQKRIRREHQRLDEEEHGYFIGSARITPEDFNVKDFTVSLQPYSLGGRFGFLLNDRHPKDLFSSRFTVFEVDALSQVDDGTKEKKFYSLCILCMMNAFDKKMRENRTAFKHLIIEEAWTAISNESMSGFLRSLWKTARKFNTSAMVVTQEMNDILSSEIIKETIVKNSATKYLLDQSNNRTHFGQIATYMGLSQKACNLIFSINRETNPYSPHAKEVFIQLGDRKAGVYSTEVSPAEAIAFESAKDRKEPFLRRARELGSYTEAIKDMTSCR